MPPRGEGYSLMRLIASSKQTSYDYDTVDPDEKYRTARYTGAGRETRASRPGCEMPENKFAVKLPTAWNSRFYMVGNRL